MFGLAGKWKRRRPDRLTRLAAAIEATAERDRKLAEQSAAVDRLRAEGACALHGICRDFVDALNDRLSVTAVVLDPPDYAAGSYSDGVPNLFQINLRGRLLEIEFAATRDLYSTEEFRRSYVLQGTIRAFNQELLDHDTVDEHAIFYCADGREHEWCHFDSRSYRTGAVTKDFLAGQMERLIAPGG